MRQFMLKVGGRTLPLGEGPHDVGRTADCWLTLDDELASRKHMRIHVQGSEVEVEDLDSRNGTYVNGDRIVGRRSLIDGDRIRVGRELLTLTGCEEGVDDDQARRTLAPGEDTQFPNLIGALVEKSLKIGKTKDAERYVTALLAQLTSSRVPPDHAAARALSDSLMVMAERTHAGIWVDRLFKLYASQDWMMELGLIDRVHGALARIPRVPGRGIRDYEARLRRLARQGETVAPALTIAVGELADAYCER